MTTETPENHTAAPAGFASSIEKARAARARKRQERLAAAAAGPSPEPDRRFDEVLSDDEIEQIYAEAKAKVLAEKKKARRAEVFAQALADERRGTGLLAPEAEEQNRLDEIVDVYISLPAMRGLGGRRIEPQPILLDQKIFYPNRSYPVTRAQAQTLISMMGMAHLHAEHVAGASRSYYDLGEMRVMHQGGFAAGSLRTA